MASSQTFHLVVKLQTHQGISVFLRIGLNKLCVIWSDYQFNCVGPHTHTHTLTYTHTSLKQFIQKQVSLNTPISLAHLCVFCKMVLIHVSTMEKSLVCPRQRRGDSLSLVTFLWSSSQASLLSFPPVLLNAAFVCYIRVVEEWRSGGGLWLL